MQAMGTDLAEGNGMGARGRLIGRSVIPGWSAPVIAPLRSPSTQWHGSTVEA
jgi:hypothetical protein